MNFSYYLLPVYIICYVRKMFVPVLTVLLLQFFLRRLSHEFIMFPFDYVFDNFIVASIGSYSCWLSRMCFVYSNVEFLVVMYLLCFLYLLFKSCQFVLFRIGCMCGFSFRRFHDYLVDFFLIWCFC